MQPAKIAPKRPLDRGPRSSRRRRRRSDDCEARRQRDFLQDRLSACLFRRLAAHARAGNAGKKVFVDLKLHDIGNTVARGVESIATLGATFLTVHAYPQTMKAAVEARAGSDLKILAVTVLTSYDDGDLHAAGYRLGVSDLVEARAQQAQVLGVDGLVCSAGRGGVLAQDRRASDEPGDAGHPAGRRFRR